MRKIFLFSVIAFFLLILFTFSFLIVSKILTNTESKKSNHLHVKQPPRESFKILEQQKPSIRSESKIKGIITHFKTDKKEIALTFDACKGKVDWKLINFLIENKIPATLFWTSLWIKENPLAAKEISKNPLFDIQNHGHLHKPCFVDETSVYGIKAPKGGVVGVIDEIENGNQAIENIIRKKTIFYRSGTAYYDNICVEVVKKLGYKIAGFSIAGDAGATFTKNKIKKTLLSAKSGDIIVMHMNHPEKDIAEAVIEAVPILKNQGFQFILLKEAISESKQR